MCEEQWRHLGHVVPMLLVETEYHDALSDSFSSLENKSLPSVQPHFFSYMFLVDFAEVKQFKENSNLLVVTAVIMGLPFVCVYEIL